MIDPVITARSLGEEMAYLPLETQHLAASVICEESGGPSDKPYELCIRIKTPEAHRGKVLSASHCLWMRLRRGSSCPASCTVPTVERRR